MSRFVTVAIACLLVTAQAIAHERPSIEVFGVNENYEVVVPLVDDAPIVDGKLDEPAWEKAAKFGALDRFLPTWGNLQPKTLQFTS